MFQLKAHWVRISLSGSEKSFGHVPPVGVEPSTSWRPPYPLGQALRAKMTLSVCVCTPILVTTFLEWLSGTEPLPHTPGAINNHQYSTLSSCTISPLMDIIRSNASHSTLSVPCDTLIWKYTLDVIQCIRSSTVLLSMEYLAFQNHTSYIMFFLSDYSYVRQN